MSDLAQPICNGHLRMCTRRVLSLVMIVLVLFAAAGCQDSGITPTPDPVPDDPFLVEATLQSTVTSSQVKLLAQFSGLGLDIDEFKYDVEIFRVVYRTSFKSEEIMASGLVILPKTELPVGMLSFQHGTIVLQSDAPSALPGTDPNTLLYGSISSSGFIGVIPDYLGFGSSSSVLHPYYVEEFTASAVLDMLKAARELAEAHHIDFNGRLFLAGYSEGGYATMAAHKALEKTPIEGFDLVTSFAGAGAYDITAMQSYLFGLDSYGDPHYLAYLALAYKNAYDFTSVLTDFFKEPYATRIPTLFDGTKGAGAINAQLTDNLSDLVQDDLVNGLTTNPSYAYLVDAFAENSLTDWTPAVPIYLYHGESDATVPYENSVSTYDALISHGASPDIVIFISLQGTHSTAITPYIQDFVPKLWALR